MSEQPVILTVGHSTLSYEAFLRLIRSAGVTAVADVRSAPYSRHHPHFNRDMLRDELKLDGVAYVFLGEELGGGRASRASSAMAWRTMRRWPRLRHSRRD